MMVFVTNRTRNGLEVWKKDIRGKSDEFSNKPLVKHLNLLSSLSYIFHALKVDDAHRLENAKWNEESKFVKY